MKQTLAYLAIAITGCSTTPSYTPIDISSVEETGIDVNEISRPYYECFANYFKNQVAAQPETRAALDQARSICSDERGSLYKHLLQADLVKTDGSQLSGEERVDNANLMIFLIESGFMSRLKSDQ